MHSRLGTGLSVAFGPHQAPAEERFRNLSRWRELAADWQRSRTRLAAPTPRRQAAESATAEHCRPPAPAAALSASTMRFAGGNRRGILFARMRPRRLHGS